MLYFGALVGVPVYYLLFLTKKLRLRFLTGVVREMINIRRDLSDDPNTTKILHNQWKYYSPWGTPKPLSNWYLKRNKRFITHVDDYLRIDDFYSKLEERNKRLNDQTPYTQIEIEQKNRECLDLVNKVL